MTSAPFAPAGTPHCPACDRGGYACGLPRDHVGPHRVTFGTDDEGPIPDRVWDDRQPAIAPADDPRVATLLADLRWVADEIRNVGERNVKLKCDDAKLLLSHLDALAARTAELARELRESYASHKKTIDWLGREQSTVTQLESQLEQAREEIEKEKQCTGKAVGWLASAYHWTDLVDPENCPPGSDVYAEAAKLLDKAREDSTLIDALANELVQPYRDIGVWKKSTTQELYAARIVDTTSDEHATTARGDSDTPGNALRAALRQLTDRHEETRNA